MGMHEKTVIITGANSGIGRETTRALAQQGASIVMACRNLAKSMPVCETIKQETGNPNLRVMHLDLASQASIRDFARQFNAGYERLDVLINNAGTFCLAREETEDGFEKTIGTNYLGPFLLTHLLLPALKRAPEARIVNVSSEAAFHGQLDLDDLHMTRKYHSFRAYAASKLALVLFTRELAERLQGTGITANALHPGHVATDIWPSDRWIWKLFAKVQRWFTISAEAGAQTSIYLATAGEVRGVSGQFYTNKRPQDLPANCRDADLQEALWHVSQALTGLVDIPSGSLST
jgi:NAD(P)-dependent dehydrogenase (short-subunit alcohol dehydrogenase family)